MNVNETRQKIKERRGLVGEREGKEHDRCTINTMSVSLPLGEGGGVGGIHDGRSTMTIVKLFIIIICFLSALGFVALNKSDSEKYEIDGHDAKEIRLIDAQQHHHQQQQQQQHRRVTLSSFGIPAPYSVPMDVLHHQRVNTIDIHLVISFCEESMSWIFDYIDTNRFYIQDIIIYSKCEQEIPHSEFVTFSNAAPTTIQQLPNVGRCDHTYATYILEHYEYIQSSDQKHQNDIIFFIKDNDYHHDQFYTFSEIFTFTVQTGFGCVEKPVCDCNNDQCNAHKDIPLAFHGQKQLNTFSINTHNRMERDHESKSAFKTKTYKKFKDWKDGMGFHIPRSVAIPVCYGGMFAIQQKQILNQSKQVWENVVNSLGRGNNIVEGHFAERIWAAALSESNEEYAKVVSDAVMTHVNGLFECWNRRGMLMVSASKGFDSSLFPGYHSTATNR